VSTYGPGLANLHRLVVQGVLGVAAWGSTSPRTAQNGVPTASMHGVLGDAPLLYVQAESCWNLAAGLVLCSMQRAAQGQVRVRAVGHICMCEGWFGER
jgi:hypothetical protein